MKYIYSQKFIFFCFVFVFIQISFLSVAQAVKMDRYLYHKSKSQGYVSVIVTLTAPRIKVTNINSPAYDRALLRSVADIQTRVLRSIPKDCAPRRVRRYSYTPQMSMTVNSKTLQILANHKSVVSIQEDLPQSSHY